MRKPKISAKTARRHKKAAAANTSHWLEVCRSKKRTAMLKRADLGGEADSMPFEQAFSNLAHAYLEDKAPGLREYELGFQVNEFKDGRNPIMSMSKYDYKNDKFLDHYLSLVVKNSQ